MEGEQLSEEDAHAGSCIGPEGYSTGSSDGGTEGSDLESMTGKGIRCLCSELLELKKSSDEGFQRSVYSSYSTFLRIFKEVGDIESELMELKRHVSNQKQLVNNLIENFYVNDFSEDLIALKIESDFEVGNYLPSKLQTHSISVLEKLDILSLEQQFEEALDVLETENEALQKIDMEGNHILAENIASCKSALSEWKIALADQLAALAGHPRVTAAELQKLLSLLCRLGENHQANSLLIQFYHLNIVNRMHDLHCPESLPDQMYFMELAKIVFSVISQAARSFVMLCEETSSYSSEFMVWVMEEIKTFTHHFDTYIRSISEMNAGFHLAIEGMTCAISFCSLLKPQRLVLQSYLMKSIQPCMKEALQMHVNHLRKTINTFTATDTWILRKFLVFQVTREKLSLVDGKGKLECCLLTYSGRKFVALIQGILEDISTLSSLQMENSILSGIGELFNEYITILEQSMPIFGNYGQKSPSRISYAHRVSQEFSLLVNSSTLVDYLFSTTKCIFEGVKASNDEQFSEEYQVTRNKELESWISSIQDAADRLRGMFCLQFIDRYFSATVGSTRTGFESHMKSLDLADLQHSLMPSSELQMLFQQLQQLDIHGKVLFGYTDEKVEKLLKDLMDAAVATIPNNIEFWRESEDSSCIRQVIWFKQFVLDVYFLVEISRFRGHLSDRLMETSRNLMASVESMFLDAGVDTSSAVTDDAWASAAAKAAIQKLVEMAPELEPGEKRMNDFEEFNCESAQASSEHDAIGSIELSDGEVEIFGEMDIANPEKILKLGVNFLDGVTIDFKAGASDDKNSSSSTAYVDMEEMDDALGPEAWISESEGTWQTETALAGFTTIFEGDDAGRKRGYVVYANELVVDGLRNSSGINANPGTVESMLTQVLAAETLANTAIEKHCLGETAELDEDPCN